MSIEDPSEQKPEFKLINSGPDPEKLAHHPAMVGNTRYILHWGEKVQELRTPPGSVERIKNWLGMTTISRYQKEAEKEIGGRAMNPDLPENQQPPYVFQKLARGVSKQNFYSEKPGWWIFEGFYPDGRIVVTAYEVRQGAVLKHQAGETRAAEPNEIGNLARAAKRYYHAIEADIYS